MQGRLYCSCAVHSPSSPSLPRKPRQRRSKVLFLLLDPLLRPSPLRFPQLLDPHPLLIHHIPPALLPQILPQTTILSPAPLRHLRHRILRLSIQILFLLPRFRRNQIQVPDEIRIQRDHLRLEFVEQGLDLGFLALLGRFVGIEFQGVEIGFAGPWHNDAGEAGRVRDPEDVFERAPAHALDALARAAPGHVGALDFGARGSSGLGEEVAPDGDLGAPAYGCETAVADGDGGAGVA